MSKKFFKIVFILILVLILFNQSVCYSKSQSRVRFAAAMQPTSVLTIIAQEKGFFGEQGLDVEFVEYPSGKRALHEGLLAGVADIAESADVPIVRAFFARSDFKIIAVTGVADSIQKIVARKDSGILKPADLSSKLIATQKGSAVHYFLHSFLIFNNIFHDNVEIEYRKAEELVDLLVLNKIDAFSMREPYISQAVERLGNNAIVFSQNNTYLSSSCLIVRDEFLSANREDINKFLKALYRAELYVANNKATAINIVAKKLNSSPLEIEKVWERSKFELSLSQTTLMTLEALAVWILDHKLVVQNDLPNFLNLIEYEELEKIKEDAVTIYR